MNHRRSAIVLSIFALLIIVYGVTVLVLQGHTPAPKPQAPRPAPSAAVLTQLATAPAFQYLVSYTGNGFAPRTVSIKNGETIRFTNNSSADLWIIATGTPLYPSIQNGCGSSAFDSCQPVSPGGFWELTFNAKGTWKYNNTLKQSDAATVVVK
jgi:plastocyanin